MQVYKIILAILFCCISWAYGLVKISGLQDFDFGSPTFPVTSDLEVTHTFCMYRNNGRNVRLTATGANSSPGFYLSNGTDTIQYQVWVANPGRQCSTPPSGGNGCAQLTPGNPRNRRAYRNNNLAFQNCNGGNTLARLTIFIPASSLTTIPSAGNYSDTLTLLLQPR